MWVPGFNLTALSRPTTAKECANALDEALSEIRCINAHLNAILDDGPPERRPASNSARPSGPPSTDR